MIEPTQELQSVQVSRELMSAVMQGIKTFIANPWGTGDQLVGCALFTEVMQTHTDLTESIELTTSSAVDH